MDPLLHRHPSQSSCGSVRRRRGLYNGVAQGTLFLVLYLSYALALYFGSWLIVWNVSNGGEVWANAGDAPKTQFFFGRRISGMNRKDEPRRASLLWG